MKRSKRPPNSPLNLKQGEFIRQYLAGASGKQAAILAGYSPRSAESSASVLLSRPKIQAAIAAISSARAARFELQADQVLNQLARMVFIDPRQFVDEAGHPIPLHGLSEDAAAAVQGLEIDQLGGGVIRMKYKLVDRGAAVEKAMRYLGLFAKDNSQSGSAIGQLMSEIHGAGSRIPVKP